MADSLHFIWFVCVSVASMSRLLPHTGLQLLLFLLVAGHQTPPLLLGQPGASTWQHSSAIKARISQDLCREHGMPGQPDQQKLHTVGCGELYWHTYQGSISNIWLQVQAVCSSSVSANCRVGHATWKTRQPKWAMPSRTSCSCWTEVTQSSLPADDCFRRYLRGLPHQSWQTENWRHSWDVGGFSGHCPSHGQQFHCATQVLVAIFGTKEEKTRYWANPTVQR